MKLLARPRRFERPTSAFGGRRSITGNASGHSEISANLLNGLRSNFLDFSERALIVNANSFPDLSPRAEPPRTSCRKPLFARAVRLSVVHSEIRRVRHACDAVRVWLPRRRDCPFHRLLGGAVESGGVSARLSDRHQLFAPDSILCTIMCTRFLQGISSGCLCPAGT